MIIIIIIIESAEFPVSHPGNQSQSCLIISSETFSRGRLHEQISSSEGANPPIHKGYFLTNILSKHC